jgi:hypothetical protein
MTFSVSKNNVPFMTLSLGMVSMISPADAALVFSQVIGGSGGSTYACNTDSNKNPYSDCINSMAKICNTTDPTWDSTKKANCQTGVNKMFGNMNSHWQAVRYYCGQWPFTLNGVTYPAGVYPSTACTTANSNLIAKGFYRLMDGSQVPVTSVLTDSINLRLWGNTVLKTIVQHSPECSSVVESWKKMGKTTSVSATSATACCYYVGSTTQTSGIPGVRCNSIGIVTEINWGSQGLRYSIPLELGNLPKLLKL